MKFLSQHGMRCLGVDVSAQALELAQAYGEVLQADLEGQPWPLESRRFDAVVVTHYLWRPLWPHLVHALSDHGVLIYETFALGQEQVGKPSRPEFLLKPQELLEMARQHHLTVLAFEDLWLDNPKRRMQRLVARRDPF